MNAEKDGGWRPGTMMTIANGQGDESNLSFGGRIGDENKGLLFSIGRNTQHPGITILSGVAEYYAFDVMWDNDRQQLLLRKRR